MKKILVVALAAFAFNVLAAAPAGDAKPADKTAKKAPSKDDKKAPKADAGTAM